MSEEYHWVERGGKRYLRRKPATYDNPTPPQRRIRSLFGLSAYRTRGRWGKAEITDKEGVLKEVPATAQALQGELKDVRVAPEPVTVTPPLTYPVYVSLSMERVKATLEALRLALKP